MEFAVILTAAFFLGAVPTAFWAGRLKGIDIRQHGSGNVGATNAFRVLGKGPGIAVFVFDFLKGAAPVWAYRFWLAPAGGDPMMPLWVGLAAILGHVFTPFLKFKGGKGIATGAGVLLGASPPLFLIATGVWILVFKLSGTVSIASLAAVSGLLIGCFALGLPSPVCGFFGAITLFVFWTHRANIRRIMRGEEPKTVNKTK